MLAYQRDFLLVFLPAVLFIVLLAAFLVAAGFLGRGNHEST
jgi:hypothetical protein